MDERSLKILAQRTKGNYFRATDLNSLAEIYNRASKEEPVIILDDVFSELDKDKQNNLMEYLKNKQQVFITCTEYKNIIETRNFNNLEVLKISKGNVVERGSI